MWHTNVDTNKLSLTHSLREMERRFAAERVSVSTTRELGVDPDAKEVRLKMCAYTHDNNVCTYVCAYRQCVLLSLHIRQAEGCPLTCQVRAS